ncbi:NrdH-redoxin [Candidatus Micrarchaeota archaeon CG08_land_8_20_14_0_20_59_11]|nr:MAG: NrdH-redoxin [Candidatus Micrarchaeota archaeon CG08_land_8_20_14_0_20_59_11]
MAKVKVYSTPACPYCVMAKDFLKKNGVEYEDVDVSQDAAAAEEMIHKSGQTGVPVIEIDGEIIKGFDVREIKRVLKL